MAHYELPAIGSSRAPPEAGLDRDCSYRPAPECRPCQKRRRGSCVIDRVRDGKAEERLSPLSDQAWVASWSPELCNSKRKPGFSMTMSLAAGRFGSSRRSFKIGCISGL